VDKIILLSGAKIKKLHKEQFEKAKHFMKTYAQDIDLAMFEYYFENKPKFEVIDIHATYQNKDGGFGTLDYDFEYTHSCLKQTESACRYIFALDVPESHQIIQKVMPYIIKNYNERTGEWNNHLVPDVNNYPHAFWWTYEEADEFMPSNHTDLIDHYDPNTNSALAGMVVKYSSLVPEKLANKISSIVIEKINSGYEFAQYSMMSDIYFVNAIKEEELKKDLLNTLMGDGNLISILDKDWGTENAYKLCGWIDSPTHPYYEKYKDDVDNNLDFLINSQNEDGSWSPSWSWGEPNVWERVEKRLKGLLTLNFLWSLKRFQRIAE